MADAQTLEGVTATGRVSGLFFELTVEQRYRNASGRNIEAVYSFPLPWGAELMSLEFDLGGPTLAGTVSSASHALASFCPISLRSGTRPARTAKILVDCSGSMNGSSIEAARRALHAILFELEFEDRFSLSRFGSRVEHLDEGLQPVTDETIARAGKAVMALRADLGGTELAAALASTLARDRGERADVLLITDGQSWNAEGIVKTAQASGQRVFVVGIGAASAESLLRNLAEETGGACEFVTAGEAAERAITRMFSRMAQVPTRGARLSWPSVPEWEVPVGSSIFEGETVHAFARFSEAPSGPVRLAFSLADAGEVVAEVELGRQIETATDLPRMAASKLLRSVGKEEQLRLALRYQLITDQTNCVLVHERAEGEKAAQLPQLVNVEQMLARGWGGVGRANEMISAGISCMNAVEPQCRVELESPTAYRACRDLSHGDLDPFIAAPRGPSILVQSLNTSFMDTLLGRTRAPCLFSHLESLGVPDHLIGLLRALTGIEHEERFVVAMFLLLVIEAVAPEGGKRHVKRELRGVLRGHSDPKRLRQLLEDRLGPIDPRKW